MMASSYRLPRTQAAVKFYLADRAPWTIYPGSITHARAAQPYQESPEYCCLGCLTEIADLGPFIPQIAPEHFTAVCCRCGHEITKEDGR